MTDKEKFYAIIKEKGIKLNHIANALGITYAGLYKKIHNETEFKQSEIVKLTKLLGLSNKQTNEIFFS